jgi:biotin transport system substrate-specific component
MPNTIAADRSAARDITTSALLAALLAASAIIAIPAGPVPFTLQTLVLVLIALTQRPSRAALTVLAYLLVGFVGLPVFSGMRGGLGVLLGPTGGYLIGFWAGAVLGSWLRATLVASGRSGVATDALTAAVVIVVVYAFGWLQLELVTSMGAVPALLAGVAPFVVPDALKAAGAVALAPFVRRAARIW